VEPEATGRPGYHPATMLKIYLYGYLNQVQSSRRLERECQRNVELMWLVGQLTPDFKTIADFRRDNGPAMRKVCRQFVALCRDLHLLDAARVAIDGSKFKAVNNREKNFTHDRLKRRIAAIDESITRYLAELDRADRQAEVTGVPVPAVKIAALGGRIEALKAKMHSLSALEAKLVASGENQISLTDPDARAMTSKSHSAYTVGYNVQSAVDTKHHLIVTHEVTNVGNDTSHLARMGKQTQAVLKTDALEVIADRGYFDGEEILACEQADITVTLPKPLRSGAKAQGRFGKQDFVYLPEQDVYRCPADERLIYRYTREQDGKNLRYYWTSACSKCPLKTRCTTGPERRVARWEHEHVVEAVQRRLDEHPEKMRQRRETVEHPFATLKERMGATHFLTKTLPKVAAEMALSVLAYNLTRVMNIVGIKPLMAAIAT
jgi:transposase